MRDVVKFDAGGDTWTVNIDHIYVDPTISTELRNSYVLTAHGRLVGDPVSITRKYALNELPNGRAYVAVVSGLPLDERVDQQRLGFRFNNEQKEALEGAIFQSVERFLSDHVRRIRVRQRAKVESVLYEHPQLASQIEDLGDYVAKLSPGMDDEQIGQNLFTLLYREEREIRKRVASLAKRETLTQDDRDQIQSTLAELSEQERNRLAELVVKRHQVLETAQMLLKYSDETQESYAYEKAIHDIICPMGRMYTSGDYDDHNLWIIDESLAGYQFFASDKSIKSLVMEGGSLKEPDIIFFNPLGFRQQGGDDPISIVEFKRPGDKIPSNNPVSQVLEYVEELRGNSVKDVDGEIVCDVKPTTPFNCFIVCELTDRTRRMLQRSVAQTQMPDGEGYYGWSTPHNAFIQVISFRKMLRDAYVRSKAFFDALRLENPSAGARRRAARARGGKLARKAGTATH